ncbi:redoxin domain-containing protein [Tenacibaculum sp.]|uniref:redoxin domain-containing protein n=1 Tax=Tenacibaculum sp. TaxID=1906242 RepID=UPI003D113AF8
MKKSIYILIISSILSCSKNENSNFSLNGKTKGFIDGTYVYLQIENETIDSTRIKNDSFNFKTKFSNLPIKAHLKIKQPPQYKSIWIENNKMLFDASNTEFIRYAKITGSETQKIEENFYKKIQNLSYKESVDKEMDFVKNNPNSILSAYTLSFYSTTFGKAKTEELFNLFSPENKKSIYGKQIVNYLSLNKDPKIGEEFTDFEMKNQYGLKKRLSDLRGKIILLEFWSSWCGPCRQENPNLVKTYNKFKDKGFEIFAVSVDNNRSSWINAIETDSLSWVHVNDHLKGDRNIASLIYGINSIPDNFLISTDGKIISRNLRGKELDKKLNQIFK